MVQYELHFHKTHLVSTQCCRLAAQPCCKKKCTWIAEPYPSNFLLPLSFYSMTLEQNMNFPFTVGLGSWHKWSKLCGFIISVYNIQCLLRFNISEAHITLMSNYKNTRYVLCWNVWNHKVDLHVIMSQAYCHRENHITSYCEFHSLLVSNPIGEALS